MARRLAAIAAKSKQRRSAARATRPADELSGDFVRRYVEWGAGPRGGQNLILAAKSLAVLDGQPAITADHVRQAAAPVLRHRVLPNFNAAGEGIDADRIVEEVVRATAEPAYSG